MTIEYTQQEVIGNTRHDFVGFPCSIKKGAVIDMRERGYDYNASVQAYIVISDIEDIKEYLKHSKPKSEIPANRGRPHLPKYAQWYEIDIEKLKRFGKVEECDYFEF